MGAKEKAIEIMKSNLPDEVKIELIWDIAPAKDLKVDSFPTYRPDVYVPNQVWYSSKIGDVR